MEGRPNTYYVLCSVLIVGLVKDSLTMGRETRVGGNFKFLMGREKFS